MSRIADAFARMKQRGGPGLVAYVTAGDPDDRQSRETLLALERGGADVIEVGVPFSDPIADGPVIQRASERALVGGTSLASTLRMLADTQHPDAAPRVLFTYVNPVLRMGLEAFAARAREAGVDGILMLDLPIEEAGQVRRVFDDHQLDQIFLVSPTTSDARVRDAAAVGRGFLYAISRLGVTGSRETVASTAEPLVARLRAVSSLPIALGFGISTPAQVAEVCRYADAAVVGSAIVQVVADTTARGVPAAPAVERFVRWLKGGER